jgi:hypothetical protein
MSIVARIRQITIKALAIIGTLTLIALLARFAMASWIASKYDLVAVVYSPDKTYKAILFNKKRGMPDGYVNPLCFNTVSVVPVAIENDAAKSEQYLVYRGGCHSLGLSGGPRLEPPQIKWLSGKELEITFNPTTATADVAKVELSGHDASSYVTLQYKALNP